MFQATLTFPSQKSKDNYVNHITPLLQNAKSPDKPVYNVLHENMFEITIEFAFWECDIVLGYICDWDNNIILNNMKSL